jgi:hypothetical protein
MAQGTLYQELTKPSVTKHLIHGDAGVRLQNDAVNRDDFANISAYYFC